MLYIRSLLFYLIYIVGSIVWASVSFLIAWAMPYQMRFRFVIVAWVKAILFGLRITCSIRVRLVGSDNIPKRPCVVLSNHQSTWETLFLQTLFVPQATVIKTELLKIPFWGWAFQLLRPIAIDRSSPRRALIQIIKQGKERLDDDIWVVMFPEGSRTNPGEIKSFQRSGPMLACNAGTPILPVVHDSGRYWPAHRFLKYPGTIDVRIGPPIATEGKSASEISNEARVWMEDQLSTIKKNPTHPG